MLVLAHTQNFGHFGDVGIDMNAVVKSFNGMEPSADAARYLISRGLAAVDEADSEAGSTFFRSYAPQAEPGAYAQRNTIRGHLQYYDVSDDAQLMDGYSDILDWAQQAIVAYNAVAEADASRAANRDAFLTETYHGVLAFPAKTLSSAISAAAETAANLVAAIPRGLATGLGIPTWAGGLIIVAVLAGGGVLIWHKVRTKV